MQRSTWWLKTLCGCVVLSGWCAVLTSAEGVPSPLVAGDGTGIWWVLPAPDNAPPAVRSTNTDPNTDTDAGRSTGARTAVGVYRWPAGGEAAVRVGRVHLRYPAAAAARDAADRGQLTLIEPDRARRFELREDELTGAARLLTRPLRDPPDGVVPLNAAYLPINADDRQSEAGVASRPGASNTRRRAELSLVLEDHNAVFRLEGRDWVRLPPDPNRLPGSSSSVQVDGETVTAEARPGSGGGEGVVVDLSVERPGGSVPLATVSAEPGWRLVPWGKTAAVVWPTPRVTGSDGPEAETRPGPLEAGEGTDTDGVADAVDAGAVAVAGVEAAIGTWSAVAVDLRGRVVRPAGPVAFEAPGGSLPAVERLLLFVILIFATLLMTVLWFRPSAAVARVPRLPTGMRPGSLRRRLVAGLVDLAPGLALVSAWQGSTPWAMLERWPNVGPPLELPQLVGPLLLVAITVTHTAVAEAWTSRSLGKAVTGLRVVDLRGRPAPIGRVLVRCASKALDLLAFLLLVLAVLSPTRQRLGDLLAGTVVVEAAEPD